MSDASLAVQTAIYARLSALLDPTPVYDNPGTPQDEVPIYVQIGEDNATPSNTKTHNGSEHVIEINVYSSKRGFAEVKGVLKRIYNELHRRDLSLTGFQATKPQFDFSECFGEPDGSRGVIRFRFQTES